MLFAYCCYTSNWFYIILFDKKKIRATDVSCLLLLRKQLIVNCIILRDKENLKPLISSCFWLFYTFCYSISRDNALTNAMRLISAMWYAKSAPLLQIRGHGIMENMFFVLKVHEAIF